MNQKNKLDTSDKKIEAKSAYGTLPLLAVGRSGGREFEAPGEAMMACSCSYLRTSPKA